MQMTMVLALGTVLGAVALRILTNLESTKRMLPGVDLAVLMVAAVAVWAVVAALARFLVLVLREQPDYRADHETEPNGSAERE